VSHDVDAAAVFYGPGRWSEKASKLASLAATTNDVVVRRYADEARSVAKFTWEPGDIDMLGADGTWLPVGDPNQQPYGLVVRDQESGLRLLEEVGAMKEIFGAVTSHCEQHRPSPPYQPQSIKARLAGHGWLPEVRVPPPSSELDELPTNDRYDVFKFFNADGGEFGVAIEIEGWEINNDLLKFWRGHTRGQIRVGVVIQPDPATLRYCFEHMRLLTQPLFGHIPLVFVAPDGEGLAQTIEAKVRKFKPFLMPRS
jgi:hypothetical protein